MRKICKGKRTAVGIALTFIMISGMLTGCGSKDMSEMAAYDTAGAVSSQGAMDTANIKGNYQAESMSDSGSVNAEILTEQVQDNRKLIKTVDMNVETEEYDQLMVNIQNKVKSMGGYIEHMNTSGTAESGNRNGYISARVAADQVDQFVTDVSEISNITYKSENIEDVTLTYVDLESHKKMLQAEEARLLELMENAETMEDIIAIESRLTDIRYQIESMESQLRTFDNQIDFSTVGISISEVRKLTVLQEQNAWERMSTGFCDNLVNVGYGLKEFGIRVVVYLPFILLFAIVLLIIVLIIRSIKKAANKRKMKVRAYNGAGRMPMNNYAQPNVQQPPAYSEQNQSEQSSPEQNANQAVVQNTQTKDK